MPSKPRRSRLPYLLVLPLLLAGLVEAGSAMLLYRASARQGANLAPQGLATVQLLKRVFGKPLAPHWTADPQPLYVADARYGYLSVPGVHAVTQDSYGHRVRFKVDIVSPGRRSASAFPIASAQRLILLGDSTSFGWGVDDELAFPWLLQSALPDRDVVNRSELGWATIGALLALRDDPPRPGDWVVLNYQRVHMRLNIADPDWLRQLPNGITTQLGDAQAIRAAGYPYGRIGPDGRLQIANAPMDCASGDARPICLEGAGGDGAAVTLAAIHEMRALAGDRLLVAYFWGGDDDPVIAALRSEGVPIADVRPPPDSPEAADRVPGDVHPGPYRHHQIYAQLLDALVAQGWVSDPPQP